MHPDLLSEIEAFLQAHGMSATTFGDKALADRHFVHQLRRGRRVWPETAGRARNFMVTYKPESQAA